jgi:hypothetical protein
MACVDASSVRTEAEPASWCFFLRSARNILSRGVEPVNPRALISS